ncbi:hypothetical protein F443_01044 [Phytophthora nicotianae P1569]|uniref:Ig-like domain-containing protein n=1 Tax=Phytophthora nicotianae P1569 TaxID=1317065 RepID=V9FZC6_PHYNI|nr:hypothetical protein F443_01044 [Phytophthora nicotianae P1569]
MELPLHAAVTALYHSDDALDKSFELLGSIYAIYPGSTELLDHQRRPPLYYALEQRWGLEKLSWIVDKSLNNVLEKDSDGLSPVTHARMNGCPEELVIRLAVAAASRCTLALDELLNGQHFESARRFCHRALQDFFAGVPKFPHARCREVLNLCRKYGEGHAYTAAKTIRDVWIQYDDTWGHVGKLLMLFKCIILDLELCLDSGAPLLQRDLPETLYPVIDSFVEVALVAKGEPLTYQWFIQPDGQDAGVSIDGATQSFIFISPSIQPHNEGIYYCEVSNRRGKIVSTRMVLRVVDDRVLFDPALNFIVDRALLTPAAHTVRCLRASAGGRVNHEQTGAIIVFQPDFFVCLDRDGNDVSDTHGVEIAISRRVDDETKLILRNGEKLISCLIEILPKSMGDLLRPALFWLPHCIVADASYTAVVVEVAANSGRILRDVDHACISEEFARVAINRLGTFAVISRPNNLSNDGGNSKSAVERARLFILRPKNLSASSLSEIKVLLTLVRDLPNCCLEAESRLREIAVEVDSEREWVVDSFQLSIPENLALNVEIAGGGRVIFRWPPPSSEVVASNVDISLENLLSSSDSDVDKNHPAFVKLPIRAGVCKTSVQKYTRVNSVGFRSSDEISSPDSKLLERDWTVLIPFLRDAKEEFDTPPPTPSLVERTNTHLVLELNPTPESQHEEVNAYQTTKSEERAGTIEQRTFTPYFYVVEMATFSPTFWRRYDQTWWFDKTKTNIIDGMYKVLHRGFGTKVTISTSAYAGCIRVASCSIDRFGDYCNPLLLPPLDGEPLFGQELAAIVYHSAEMETTSSRLQQLLDDLQIDSRALNRIYGLPRSVRNATDAVAALLDNKMTLRSCNFELALLLSGYKTLERQLTQIKLASDYYIKLMEPFLRVQRVLPGLERCPIDSMPIIHRLHELLREAYEVIAKLSSPGWLQYFLMDEWFEDALHKVFVSLAEILASDCCSLQCARALRTELEVPADSSIPWIMKTVRSYLRIAVGRLEEATDQEAKLLVCRELCHTLHLHSDSAQSDGEEDPIAAKFLTEFESPESQRALKTLRQQDSFSKHLVSVTPQDGEKCAHVPDAVHFDLDPFIRGVNRTGMHLVIRVANVSLDNCVVQGKATFCERTARLSFIPAAEFEHKSRYRVSVREHEILSSLGGTLPERPPFTIHFSTPA